MSDQIEWLRDVCAELLGSAHTQLDMPPLVLGINSITAVQLAARISTEFDIDLNPAAVLRAKSLAGLVSELSPRPPEELNAAKSDFIALTDMQVSFYIANQLTPDSSAFHCPLVWRVTGAVDGRVMDLALADLAVRHPLLRGTLEYDDDGLGLRIADRPYDRLRRFRVRDEQEALDHVQAAVREPLISSDDAPLWRAVLASYGDGSSEQHLFALVNHHMLVDWVSAQILLEDLSRFYARREIGEYPLITPTPVAHVLEDRRKRDAENRADTREFWATELKGVPQPHLKRGSTSTRDVTRLTATSTSRLRKIALEQQTTLHNVLLACFTAAYHEWSGLSDITIGVSYAYPRVGHSHNICAPLMNTLCIRSRHPGTGGLPAIADQITERVIDAILHSALPVTKVATTAHPSHFGAPLFDVSFSYQENPPPTLAVAADAEPLQFPVDSMFPVVVTAVPDDGGILITIDSSLDGHGPTCAELLDCFLSACERLVLSSGLHEGSRPSESMATARPPRGSRD